CPRIHSSVAHLADWRKVAGVEPTRERSTPPTGFEARPHHRMRMPSELAFFPPTPISGAYRPSAVSAQHVRIAHASSVANAVEELQDLHRALATETERIAVLGCLDRTMTLRAIAQVRQDIIDAFARID